MRRRSILHRGGPWLRGAALCACLILLVAFESAGDGVASAQEAVTGHGVSQSSRDIYYHVEGEPVGPPAPSSGELTYPRYGGLDNRLVIWLVTQQHTYFGGFVLALPIFCLIMELIGLMARDRSVALRYDRAARDFLKVSLLAFSVTALAGTIMLGLFIHFYPSFMGYMGGTFRSMMPIYALAFLGEAVALLTYYYSWDRLSSPALKWGHAAIGVVANVLGALLLFLANSWAAFMMAPAGVDADGRYLGNGWNLLHSALWNPLNAHRFLADLMLGGAVVMAYAAYRFLISRSEEERAYYDWVGYIFLFVTVCALLPMPFAGYWLMKAVWTFSQTMGMAMMGGQLTWLFVVQAWLVGVLFMGINYYLWQAMGRFKGGDRYSLAFRYVLLGLTLSLFVWLTPHTLVMTASEGKAMGGAQHPVIGNYGVMASKNGAINIMICLTALSYILYRRANRLMTITWTRAGNLSLALLFGAGVLNIVWLSIYGFSLPANVRIALSYPQAFTTLTVVFGALVINWAMLRGSTVLGPVVWGRISVRGMVTLFGLAAAFTWVMGFMGYIRSSGRLGWHVNGVMPDLSPWAFTPTLGFALQVVTLNMVVFWLGALVLFWLSSRGREPATLSVAVSGKSSALARSASHEVQPS